MKPSPEQVAENLADQWAQRDTNHWMDIKSAFIQGYIECLNNWKWNGENNDPGNSEPRRDDRKVVSLDTFRRTSRK